MEGGATCRPAAGLAGHPCRRDVRAARPERCDPRRARHWSACNDGCADRAVPLRRLLGQQDEPPRKRETLELAADRFMAAYCAPAGAASLAGSPKCRGRAAGAARASDAELLVDQARDLGAVGAAFRLAHHLPDDRADRLGVAVAHALRRVGVGRQRRRDDRRQLILAADRARAPRPRRSPPGSPPSATSRSSTWRAAPTLTRLAADEADERRERRRRDLRVGRVLAVARAARAARR